MCDQGSATSARSFGPRNSPASTVEARAPSSASTGQGRALGKAAGAGSVEDGHGRRGIDGCGGTAHRSRQTRRNPSSVSVLVVRLYPDAYIQGLAIPDVALEDRFVGNQNLGAAIGENAAHLGKREHAVQRHRDAAGANDGKKPMEALPIVGAIDGDGLAGRSPIGLAQKRIDGADFSVQFGKMKAPLSSTETSQSPFRRTNSSTRLATVTLRSRES